MNRPQIIFRLLTLLLLLLGVGVRAANLEALKGDGSEASPYLIASASDFNLFIAQVNEDGADGLCFAMTDDITVGSTAATTAFKGTFDGGLHTLSSLRAPLFAAVDGGTVRNVMLSDISISTEGNVGGICNEATGAARIYNCGIYSGTIGGTGNVGGLVGLLDGTARVINCFSFATITGGTNVGGIVGNNAFASKAADIRTMVMNCMFYGDITGGTNISPIYGGQNINNLNSGGLTTYNYYRYESPFSKNSKITSGKYNCALAVEEKYLIRFEFYRQLLNSNRRLAAYYVTGNKVDVPLLAKWVLDKDVAPYPILKPQGRYPSIINYDAEKAVAKTERNQGGLLGTLKVNISSGKTDGGETWPEGAEITKSSLTLNRTDKNYANFNFNYDKVQLPYYNDVGTRNYTANKVVTGWKITSVVGGTEGNFETGDKWGGYNFADRECTAKDLYTVSGRVFSQGAYFDVPYGVTEITIEPYWGQAAYVADEYLDVVYNGSYNAQNVTQLGLQFGTNGVSVDINGSTQKVYTTIANALSTLNGATVYDNAVVLVGNLHQNTVPSTGDKPLTVMSVDLDRDNEPDCSMIYSDNDRTATAPIRFDFLNIPGLAMAQKPNGAGNIRNVAIFKTKGWFEMTNTALMHFTEFEYENQDGVTKKENSPLILQGGVFDQFVSTQKKDVPGKTNYLHIGGNVWFRAFGMGVHADGKNSTPHVPVSVTGGDYDSFYLTGTYQPNATVRADDAECYISGGHFGEAAGAGQEQINGNVRWQIYNADIEEFYGGGVNGAKPILGNIEVDIINSHVTKYCGGPKFGDMATDKTVTTRARGCTFGTYFGAGNGGNSFLRLKYYDEQPGKEFSTYETYYTNDRGLYYDGKTTNAPGKADYGKKGPGVAADFDYEFFVWNTGQTGKRFYVKFVTFSLAQCNDVSSTLTDCTITGDFYGGGNYGKVIGTATSVLDGCTVKGSVFGAGYSASIPKVPVRDAGFTKYPNINTNTGLFEPGEYSGITEFEWKHVDALPKNGVTGIEVADGKHCVYTDIDLTTLGQVANISLTVKGNTHVERDVYGGGALASAGDTKVMLEGGEIVGDVYGGGMGDANTAPTMGSVTVNLNEGVEDEEKGCVVGGRIFGCNNVNGTPLGSVQVNIYGTQHPQKERIADKFEIPLYAPTEYPTERETLLEWMEEAIGRATERGVHDGKIDDARVVLENTEATELELIEQIEQLEKEISVLERDFYDLTAVYGGGNQAVYKPAPEGGDKAANVTIYGCGRSCIEYVFGGGNAAPVPATHVVVEGGTFDYIFGGGNGDGEGNPGANVGYETYAEEEEKVPYGTGVALTEVHGGQVNHLYGGSNRKGNIRTEAHLVLDDKGECAFSVGETYGGGNEAPMDGPINLDLRCIPGMAEVYGGARAADVEGDIQLTITSGTFGKVFGGNNEGGRINGTLCVNVEETGCHPVIIGELYGCGNKAAYSVYGYEWDEEEGLWMPLTALAGGETPREGPQVNIISCTSIGSIYGGGYGEDAVVAGGTTVQIDQIRGKWAGQKDGEKDIPDALGAIGNVFGGGNQAMVEGDTHVLIATRKSVTLQSLSEDKVRTVEGANITGNVYGGGNRARVTGHTEVTVGPERVTAVP